MKTERSWPLAYVVKQKGLSEMFFKRYAMRMPEVVVEIDSRFHALKLEVAVKGKWKSWRAMVRKFPAYRFSHSLRLRCSAPICDHSWFNNDG